MEVAQDELRQHAKRDNDKRTFSDPATSVTVHWVERDGSNGSVLATTWLDASGSFETDFTVPSALQPGSYDVAAECGDPNGGTDVPGEIAYASLTVTKAPTPPPTSPPTPKPSSEPSPTPAVVIPPPPTSTPSPSTTPIPELRLTGRRSTGGVG